MAMVFLMLKEEGPLRVNQWQKLKSSSRNDIEIVSLNLKAKAKNFVDIFNPVSDWHVTSPWLIIKQVLKIDYVLARGFNLDAGEVFFRGLQLDCIVLGQFLEEKWALF